jgi:thioredoxin-like negative regulator of GroEL
MILAVPGIAAPTAVPPADNLWSAKAPEFRSDAATDGAPTVLYFTATWCGYCRQMERTTLGNPGVRERLEPFTRIKLDFDQQPDLVARYRIGGVPAFVMVDARGEEIARLVGMTEADPFRKWLADGSTRAAEMARLAALREADRRQLEKQLDETGPAAWAQLQGKVYEMAARGDEAGRAFALKRLAARADASPAALADGLLNEDLAVRLVVANLLRKRLGEKWEYDPWADAPARERAAAVLRNQPGGTPAPGSPAPSTPKPSAG